MNIYEELYFYFNEKCKILENNIRIVQEKIEYADQQLSQFHKRKDRYKYIDSNSSRSVFSPLKVEKKEKRAAYHDQMKEWEEKKEGLKSKKADYQEKLDYYLDKCKKVRMIEEKESRIDQASSGKGVQKELLLQTGKLKNQLDFIKQLVNNDSPRAKMELNQAISSVSSLEQMIKNIWEQNEVK